MTTPPFKPAASGAGATGSSRLPTIQALWIGGDLSLIEQLSLRSYVANGHPVHLFAYDHVGNVPAGVEVKDGREILGSERIFKYTKEGSYAGFSNVFRYKLLLERGHFWTDLDVVCLRPFDFEREYVFTSVCASPWRKLAPGASVIESCVIRCPVGSEIMAHCYQVACSKKPEELVWGEIGPDLLQAAVEEFGLTDAVQPHGTFATVDWPEAWRYISRNPIVAAVERLKIARYGTHAVHLYNEIWRQRGFDKNGAFPSYSVFEHIKRKYWPAS